MTKVTKANFRVERHGSVCLVVPLDEPARDWLTENIGADNGYQPYFPTVVIEPRYLYDVLNGIRRDGLVAAL